MKKNLLLIFAAMFLAFASSAQVVIYEDNFDSYTNGGYLCEQSDNWTTWSNNPGSAEDAVISNEEANSAPQSVLVSGTNDLVLPMGNKTSGQYELNFNYFVASGFGGYYNIQHFEAPGNEWAFEVFFSSNGTGVVKCNGGEASFNYNNGSWITIENDFNLDLDIASIYIDGTMVTEFPFSTTAQGAAGTLQLGGANFYAGAPEGETSKYYFDNIEYVEVDGGQAPAAIEVSEENITTVVNINGVTTAGLTITNVGEQDLNYELYDTYAGAANMPAIEGTQVTNPPAEIYANPKALATVPSATDADGYLSYDNGGNSAIGGGAGDFRVAALFPPSKVKEFVGMELTHIDVFIPESETGNPYNEFKLQVYSKGSIFAPGPGELIYEQAAQPVPNSGGYNHLELDQPIVLDGSEISIGYWITHDDNQFPAGCDEGPANENGDWISYGPGWSHLSDNPDLNFNWSIQGYVQGEHAPTWMEFFPQNGTLDGSESKDITVTIDVSGMPIGEYQGTANVRANDANNEYTEIPVMLTIFNDIETNTKAAVAIYPNPATDLLTISGVETSIETIEIFSQSGQLVKTITMNVPQSTIDISDLSTGLYMVNVKTTNGNVSIQKLSVR